MSAITVECCPPSERNGVRDGVEYAVSYDFTSVDGGEPLIGTLFFSSGMPVIDRCCNWVEYQPSAVVSLTTGDQTWTNAATPNGYCDVWFHVGWIQVTFVCNANFEHGDIMYRIDFMSADGSSFSYDDPDPIGPFLPDTFRDDQVMVVLMAFTPDNMVTGRGLSLDAVRITPYIDEPSLPALLVAGAAAGVLTRTRRRFGKAR